MKTALLTLALCLCAPSAPPPSTPSDAGIGVYLCHVFGRYHFRVCTPFPGNNR